MLYLYLILTGTSVGIISALFGIGGGALAVPILYTLFPEFPPQTVISTSLGMIFVNSIINFYNFTKKGKKVDKKLAFFLGLSAMIGVFLGKKFVMILNPLLVKKSFGVVLILLAAKTWLAPASHHSEAHWKLTLTKINPFRPILIGFLGGLVAGFTGLGGGAVMVPFFMVFLKMPFQWLSIYSNFTMIFATGIGALGFALTPFPGYINLPLNEYMVGYLNYLVVGLIFVGAFFSSRLGIHFHAKIPPALNKKLFIALLLLLSLKILVS